MVLDLIRSISSEENFVVILDKNKEFGASSSSQGRSARRLALRNNDRIMQVHMDMQQLRSFLSFECDVNKHWVMLSSFNFVRVLDIHTYFQWEDETSPSGASPEFASLEVPPANWF